MHVPSRREHAAGVALSICVAMIWVGSGELIQFIFGNADFKKPFFLTYITTSLFGVLLSGFLRRSWRAKLHAPSARESQYSDESAGDTTARNSPYASVSAGDTTARKFNVKDTARVAAIIAPLYFIANYTYNAGLGLTSVSSSSLISNTSSLFTLIISVVMGVEKFTWPKLGACAATVAGTAIISRVDGSAGSRNLAGDMLSVFAAFMFGLYITVLKMNAPKSDVMDLAMMLAFIGLFTACAAWPMLPVLDALRVEVFEAPSKRALGLLILNALVGSVLSDFLWAKSVVLTSALVGTIALSLTAPMALAFDSVFKHMEVKPMYLLGALLVLSGYVLVNVELAAATAETRAEEEGDEEVMLALDPSETKSGEELVF